jgi:hypothetical protein
LDRHKRLSLALAIAAVHPVHIDKASASRWLRDALTDELDGLPVVWHSVTQMYWPRDEVSAVEEVLSRYGARHMLGEVSLEYDADGPRGGKPELRTRLWNPDSNASIRERRLGIAHDHGIPVTLARS